MTKVKYSSLLMKSLTKTLSNKYVFTLVGFFLLIGFFGSKSIFSVHRKLDAKLDQISNEKDYYNRAIDKSNEIKEESFSSITKLERFARETHLMKKDNEEVIRIIEEETSN